MLKRLFIVGALLLLMVQVLVQIRLASQDSPTTDEVVHLSAGYTYLTRGDWRFNPEHPPLVKELAALSLLFLKPNLPADAEDLWQRSGNFLTDSWRENRAFGEKLLFASGNNPDLLIFYARLPIIAITFLLGLTIFLIAWKHWGEGAALVATALYALNPTVNGHGHLITTDVALALGAVLTIYTAWRLLAQPSWVRGVTFGLCLGLALLAKHTAIILLPILVLMLALAAFDKQRGLNWRRALGFGAVGLIVTGLVIWAGYGFRSDPLPETASITTDINIATQSTDEPPNSTRDKLYNFSRPLLAMLPSQYLKGVLLVTSHASGGHDSFFLGETSRTGHRAYFPLLFLWKNPLPTLLIVLGGVYIWLRRRPRESLAGAMLLGAVVFLVAAMASKANLGLRHILPIFPPLFLIGGWATAVNQKFRLVALGLLAWLALITWWSYPTYLGYYNELVGGSSNGYKIATDSNLDWGQDLRRISRYIETNNIHRPFVEYGWLGTDALDYYLGKNNYRLLSSWQPGEGGTVIIGATAVNNPEFYFVADCPDKQLISSGTFVCQLEGTDG